MKIYTVFVEAKTPGNIGFLARCMKNFALNDLVLINPCSLDESAYYQAVHAKEIVENALIYKSLDEFIEDKKLPPLLVLVAVLEAIIILKECLLLQKNWAKTLMEIQI